MTQPLAIDLFCGLFGWSEGLAAEGFRVVGFDLEDMYGAFGMERPDHFQLVIQDVRTLHGSQFRDAALIVASPPCQKFSWMAMPWTKAKERAAAIRADETGQLLAELNELFETCFRIQREACEAAGRHIPLIVENVRGAQKWVGRARWNYGSFYLWGDVPALMPVTLGRSVMKAGVTHRGDGTTNFHGAKVPGFRFDGSGKSFQTASVDGVKVATMGAGWYPPDHPKHVRGLGFNTHADRALRLAGIKNEGGSWFAIAHNTTSGKGNNPDGRKGVGPKWDAVNGCGAHGMKRRTNPTEGYGGSKSNGRKMASAMIAKIPLPLARHIAATFRPAHMEP